MNVAFCTLGCKVNQYETEMMAERFIAHGFVISAFSEIADVYVINTCIVTQMGERKSKQMIQRAKMRNPGAVIVAAGCLPQSSTDFTNDLPFVDVVVGNIGKEKVVEHVLNIIHGLQDQVTDVSNIQSEKAYNSADIESFKGRTRAIVKIEDGCDLYCSYCIIPHIRGRVRSRPVDSVLNEIQLLSENAHKEVVLTGIHIGSYGKDLEKVSLIDLVERIALKYPFLRIRLGSLEPNVITSEFIERAKAIENLCPHFHLSLQSGCDETLKRMNRRYNSYQFKTAVNSLRSAFAEAAVTTDIIVGFPGETEENFIVSYKMVESIRFAKSHIFTYSRRTGTKAASMPDQILKEDKDRRSKLMHALSKEHTALFLSSCVGKIFPVLFEEKMSQSTYAGFTPNYAEVRVEGQELTNTLKDVLITDVENEYCIGNVLA